jgi:prephenate dehydrogenase
MQTIGVIGYGSFGSFVCKWLADDFLLRVFDKDLTLIPSKFASTLEDVCKSDYLILAIPLSAYTSTLQTIKPLLTKSSVIIDVSSVKQEPIRLITEYLDGQPFVALHPLFGPESASDNLNGHKLVLCETSYSEISAIAVYLEQLGLVVIKMTAEEHDKEMAVVQGLTFFLARGLNEFGLHEMKLKTPSFEKLLSLAELDKHHSNDLLETILTGNKHAMNIRRSFMQALKTYNKKLK